MTMSAEKTNGLRFEVDVEQLNDWQRFAANIWPTIAA